MRILTVADFFYPDITGGSAIVAYELMAELSRRGHQITVLTRDWGDGVNSDRVKDIEVHRYKMVSQQAFYPYSVYRCIKELRKLYASGQYDIVNTHHASGGLGVEIARKLFLKLPSAFFFHGPWHGEAMARDGLLMMSTIEKRNDQPSSLSAKYALRRKADKMILHNCDAMVSMSDYMLEEAQAIHSTVGSKWLKLSGGVDIERFVPTADKKRLRRDLALSEDQIILLTVRRLDPRMGLENLVDAMALIEGRRQDIVLLIGGKGELESKLAQKISDLNLKNVKLLGFVKDELLPQYYQASDLFIMPSISLEGYGLATLEALASGVPVLGANTGATPEILGDLLPDFLLDDLQPVTIADKIISLLSGIASGSIVLDKRMREYAEERSWPAVTDRVEELFQYLVDGNSVEDVRLL